MRAVASTIWERQKERPRSSTIPKLIEVLQLSREDADRLFFGPTTEDRIRELVANSDPRELERAIAEIRTEIEHDAGFLGVLLDLLAGRRVRRSGQ